MRVYLGILNVQKNFAMIQPDNTAVRTALWRALHMQVDAKPYIIEDEIGLKLVAPPDNWQERPDMKYTKRLRASIVARARFIDDLIIEQSKQGMAQYVILGAGLDTFAQRHPDVASKLQIFEIDQPDTLTWKQKRLIELGFGVPDYLHFVPVNFETSSWWQHLLKAGFDPNKPAVVACTGVSLYLTKEAIIDTLNQIAALAPGSKLAMTFYLPLALLDEEDKPMQEMAEKGARAAGTPFMSFFAPEEILAQANEAGFKEAKTISTKDMEQRYFANRTDNILPASGEVFLLGEIWSAKCCFMSGKDLNTKSPNT
ncbi:MAG: methyltransferase [Bacteroidota bacterium]|nr:methyltransferase [Bacteroidota bacterium]